MVQNDLINNKCQFCGKQLNKKIIELDFVDSKREMVIGFERCNCKEAQLYWKKKDFIKKTELENAIEYEKLNRIKKLYEKSGISPRLKKYSFENFKVNSNNKKAFIKAKEYAFQCIKGNMENSLFITGNVGTGKTHLAASIANEVIKSEKTVIFGTLINLLNNIKDSYISDSVSEGQVLDKYSKVYLLVIDDLGKEKPSEWGLEKLFTIVNNRYENNLPIVITTNYNRNQLRERLSDGKNYEIVDSIISRLYEMCSGVSIMDKDKRKELA